MAKGKHIVSFFMPALIIGLSLMVLVGAVTYYLGIQQPLEQQAKKLLTARTQERALLIEQKIEQIQKSISFASQQFDPQKNIKIADFIKSHIPEATHSVLFTSDNLNVDLQASPIITHVTVELLRRAFNGEKLPAELALHEGKPLYIAFFEGLHNSEGVIEQVLLVTVPVAQFKTIVGLVEPGSYLELRQNFSGGKHAIAHMGAGGINTSKAPLVETKPFGANWSLALWQSSNNFFDNIGMLNILLTIGALLAVAIAGIVPMMSLQRILNKDARRFIQAVDKKKIPADFKLKFFNDLSASYRRIADEAIVAQEAAVADEPEVVAAAISQSAEKKVFDIDVLSVAETLSEEIFREYDIRGVVNQSLSENVLYILGRAIGSEAYSRGEQKVIVARDGRLSSPKLHYALVEGLIASGRDVVDIGMVPTPVLYLSTHLLGTRSGVMLTGSHNPKDHNGIKIVLAGETLYGRDIKNLYNRIKENDLLSGKGKIKPLEFEQSYLDKVVENINIDRPLKVAVDCGNGVTGEIVPRMLQALGCEVIGLYTNVDGNFPNHHPDPNRSENLQDLIKMVLAENADIGLAFDGDGDRLGVVDNNGKIIWTDRVLMLFAIDVLNRNRGADILYDVKCSRHLTQVIEQNGGRPVMWKTGHSLMKAKMHEIGALLGGEGSGHIYFKERWYGFDDALYSAARLLEILASDTRKASDMFSVLPESIASEEINIAVPDKIKFKLIAALQKRGKFGDAKINTIDGIRADFENSWFMIRASNTIPSLVVKFEADSEDEMASAKELLKEQLLNIAPKLKINF